MGLFYLGMLKFEQANARILDAPNPNISLSSIEHSLQDLVPHGSVFAATPKKSSSHRLKCYKCQKRGNAARDIPAVDSQTARNTVYTCQFVPKLHFWHFMGIIQLEKRIRYFKPRLHFGLRCCPSYFEYWGNLVDFTSASDVLLEFCPIRW